VPERDGRDKHDHHTDANEYYTHRANCGIRTHCLRLTRSAPVQMGLAGVPLRGIEPRLSSLEHSRDPVQGWKQLPDSNRCNTGCNRVPRLSAKPPYTPRESNSAQTKLSAWLPTTSEMTCSVPPESFEISARDLKGRCSASELQGVASEAGFEPTSAGFKGRRLAS
jgi:hypothetical protein